MNQFDSFDDVIARCCRGEVRLSRLDLYALSGPSRAEAALFAQRWPGLPVQDRRGILRTLVESAEANFELDFNDLYRLILDDPDDEVRLLAVEGLWEDEDPALASRLARMLRDDASDEVRAAAALSLGRYALRAELGDLDPRLVKVVTQALLAAVNDPEELAQVRARAVESIAYLDLDQVRGIIDRAYNEDSRLMQASAIFAMGRSGDGYWADTVLRELESAEPEARFEAAHAAGELQLAAAVPALIGFLDENDRELQEMAVWALGQIGGEQAKDALEAILASDNDPLFEAADEALAELMLGASPLLLFDYAGEQDEGPEHEEADDDDDLTDDDLEDEVPDEEEDLDDELDDEDDLYDGDDDDPEDDDPEDGVEDDEEDDELS